MADIRSKLALPLACALSAAPLAAATLAVDTDQDVAAADGFCSLREAITAANTDIASGDCPAGSGPDRIVFAIPTPATLLLGASLPQIQETLRIQGPGATLLTIDGQGVHQMVDFETAAGDGWLGVDGLTLARGVSNVGGYGGGALVAAGESALFREVIFLDNTATNGGGGLAARDLSDVRIEDCWFSGNVAEGPTGGGGLMVDDAVGIVIERSTFSDNSAAHENGGGGGMKILRTPATMRASTVSGNWANASGGGIVIYAIPSPASLALFDSTVTRNRANEDATGVSDDGGGISFALDVSSSATFAIGNTIVAENVDAGATPVGDVDLPVEVSLSNYGFNLIGDNAGATTDFPAGSPNAADDYVGTTAAPIDPRLGALAAWGGTTPSHRPLFSPDSRALDSGSCADAGGDQRGYGDAAARARAFDLDTVANGAGSDGCDIGAHERGADPDAALALFADDFEIGNLLLWSAEAP